MIPFSIPIFVIQWHITYDYKAAAYNCFRLP
jgi:hypothetical protein